MKSASFLLTVAAFPLLSSHTDTWLLCFITRSPRKSGSPTGQRHKRLVLRRTTKLPSATSFARHTSNDAGWQALLPSTRNLHTLLPPLVNHNSISTLVPPMRLTPLKTMVISHSTWWTCLSNLRHPSPRPPTHPTWCQLTFHSLPLPWTFAPPRTVLRPSTPLTSSLGTKSPLPTHCLINTKKMRLAVPSTTSSRALHLLHTRLALPWMHVLLLNTTSLNHKTLGTILVIPKFRVWRSSLPPSNANFKIKWSTNNVSNKNFNNSCIKRAYNNKSRIITL